MMLPMPEFGDRERLADLLATRATQALSAEERDELIRLQHQLEAGSDDIEAFDLAAAALDVSMLREVESMPPSLRTRVERDAMAWLSSHE